MYVSTKEATVMQAIADRINSFGQLTIAEYVLRDLRNQYCDYDGDEGRYLMFNTVKKLVEDGLVIDKLHKGERYLSLTTEAARVDNLLTQGLF